LDFARQTPPQKHLLNMNDVVEDVLSLVRNQAGFRNIAIQTSLDTAPCIVMADRDQMRQVVLNIVLNAAEAMGGVGELRIRSAVNPKTRRVHVRIQDTGPGFPEEIKYKVFEPFFTTKQTGTGLGLSIAYGILERHGGGISLESVPGRGATVSVWLPLRNDQIHG
jgi:signal transduction histidine kinase